MDDKMPDLQLLKLEKSNCSRNLANINIQYSFNVGHKISCKHPYALKRECHAGLSLISALFLQCTKK